MSTNTFEGFFGFKSTYRTIVDQQTLSWIFGVQDWNFRQNPNFSKIFKKFEFSFFLKISTFCALVFKRKHLKVVFQHFSISKRLYFCVKSNFMLPLCQSDGISKIFGLNPILTKITIFWKILKKFDFSSFV